MLDFTAFHIFMRFDRDDTLHLWRLRSHASSKIGAIHFLLAHDDV